MNAEPLGIPFPTPTYRKPEILWRVWVKLPEGWTVVAEFDDPTKIVIHKRPEVQIEAIVEKDANATSDGVTYKMA